MDSVEEKHIYPPPGTCVRAASIRVEACGWWLRKRIWFRLTASDISDILAARGTSVASETSVFLGTRALLLTASDISDILLAQVGPQAPGNLCFS